MLIKHKFLKNINIFTKILYKMIILTSYTTKMLVEHKFLKV